MIRYLSLGDVLELYHQVMKQSGGAVGVRDLGLLESAIAQPRMAFGGEELYPSLVEKASALGFSLVMNHPFVDGNKRTGHASMETFLVINGLEIDASVDEQEEIILRLADGQLKRERFTEWLQAHVVEKL